MIIHCENGCNSVGIGMNSWLENIIHVCRTPVIKKVKKIYGLMHCLNRSLIGSRLNFVNSFRPINHFHNVLRLFDILPNFPFNTSETMRDYYLQTWYLHVASRVAQQLKT